MFEIVDNPEEEQPKKAGRPKGIWTPEIVRQRMRTALLMHRLEKHGLGEVEMTASQIQAAAIVLRKVIPDLTSSSVTFRDKTKRLTYAERLAKETARNSPRITAETVEHTVQ